MKTNKFDAFCHSPLFLEIGISETNAIPEVFQLIIKVPLFSEKKSNYNFDNTPSLDTEGNHLFSPKND